MKNTRPPVLDSNFQIVIPTHNRPAKQISLERLPKEVKEKTLVITSLESEAKEIRSNYNHRGVISLEKFGALESHGQRIHTKRQWILENLRSKYILQMDDDLYYFRRCLKKYREYLDGRWKLNELGKAKGAKLLYTSEPDDVQKMFDLFECRVTEGQFTHSCICIS